MMEVKGCSKRNRWHFCENTVGTVWNGVIPALRCLDITCLCILSFLSSLHTKGFFADRTEPTELLHHHHRHHMSIIFPPPPPAPPPPHVYCLPSTTTSTAATTFLLFSSTTTTTVTTTFLLFPSTTTATTFLSFSILLLLVSFFISPWDSIKDCQLPSLVH